MPLIHPTDRAAVQAQLLDLLERTEQMWIAAQAFLRNRDAHGIMDMGAELQALARAKAELEALINQNPISPISPESP